MTPLRIALTKGRLERDTLALLESIGADTAEVRNKGRRLILPARLPDGTNIEVVLVKSADVITYVSHGTCDLGVVGKDTIAEVAGNKNAVSSFYEILDLGFGKCRFALAAPKHSDFFGSYRSRTVATSYVNVARDYFARRGMDIKIIRIAGSVELAPLLGLADAIVDIVETGSTLKENGLEIIEDIMPVSARLISGTASMKLRKQEIEQLAAMLESAI